MVSYATTTLSYQKSQALESVTLGALVATVMIPLMGLLSDKVGRQKMYTLSVVLLGLFIVPWFLLLDTGTGWGIMLATIVAFGILWAPVTAVLGTLCSEIFSANVRYTGITLGYQLGAALAGAPRRLSPPVCWRNMTVTGGRWPFIWALRWRFRSAIFCASRMKSALGTAPPGRKAPDRRPPWLLRRRLSRPAALRLRAALGRSRRGGNRLSQVR